MLRRLFNLLSALSLLLCAAVVVLWARTPPDERGRDRVWGDWLQLRSPVTRPADQKIRRGDSVTVEIPDLSPTFVKACRVDGDGMIQLPFILIPPTTVHGLTPGEVEAVIGKAYEDALILHNAHVRVEASHAGLSIPYCCLIFVLLLAPSWTAAGIVERMSDARTRRGLCRACGYDLRATPVRCPECGTAAAGKET